MKNILLFFILCFIVSNVKSQTTAIPDPNFEQALINQGIDSDGVLNGQVLTTDISGIITLNVSFSNISDLTGIEDFTALQNLSCFNNVLTSLNVSNNTNLIELYCDSNQLTNLDVSANVNLTTLWCQFNQLADLNVNGTSSLQEIYCLTNQLTNLDVSGATNLQLLYCPDNLLTSLALGANSNLTQLYCFDNQLSSIDLSNLPNLNIFWCYNNQLNNLDVITNINLGDLRCNDNQLSGSLLLDGLSSLTSFNVVNNPDLTCIQVDNETDATSGLGQYATWSIDAGASYAENCALSSDDFSLENTVVVYPNPASSKIHLELPYNIEKVTIHNILGQKMVEAKSETINISNLSRGLYFVTIQTSDNKRFHKKILVSVPR